MQSLLDLLDIQEAIRDLENCTAALHSDYDDDTDSDSVTSQKGSNQARLITSILNDLLLLLFLFSVV